MHDYSEFTKIPVDYDSPFIVSIVDKLSTEVAKFTDGNIMKAVINAGFDVDKDKLQSILMQDKERYEKAYREGYGAGYTNRDEEIVRCKDCLYLGKSDKCIVQKYVSEHPKTIWLLSLQNDWFCADGVRCEQTEDEDD